MIVARSVIVWFIVEIVAGFCAASSLEDSHELESVSIPFVDPRDCLNVKCFDPDSGSCKTPETCSNESKNETLGKSSDCFLICPFTSNNCRITTSEDKDLRSISAENLQNTHCSLPDQIDSQLLKNNSCLPSSTTGIRNYCLHKNASSSWQELKTNYLIDFQNQTIDSYYLRKELRFVMSWCEEGDSGACEHLSNICLLTLRNDSFPCKPFVSKNPPRQLFHQGDDVKIVLERRIFPTKFSLSNKHIQNNKLNFIFAKYSLDGAFKSYTGWLSPCNLFKNIRFGINGAKTCWTTAKELIELQTVFYAPHISFVSNDNKNNHLYPVPVLVKTADVDMKNVSKWLLASKFFLVDEVSGFRAVMTENSAVVTSSEIEVVRYVKSLTVQIRTQERKERGKIFPPLIILEYGELTKEDIENNSEISIEYKIVFKLTEKSSNLWFKIAVGTAFGLACVYAIFVTLSHYRRNANTIPIVKLIGWFFIYYCGSIGTQLLVITFTVSTSAFIFYKGQTVLHILLPSENTEKLIKICMIIAFAAKFVEIVTLVFQLRRVNVFFIDWETPRKTVLPATYDSPRTSMRKAYNQRFPKETAQQTPSEVIAARRNRTPSKSSQASQASTPSKHSIHRNLEAVDEFSPNYIDVNFAIDEQDVAQNSLVSMWRTYIIANQWLKMKTMRRINLLVHILATLFFIEIVGFKNWALAIPSLKRPPENLDIIKENFTLKYAIGSFTYALLYALQWFVKILYTRYYRNKLHDFVDLCSVANISIFMLMQDYYGYYVHGRSVHGFADTDLMSVINDLKREEDNLCAHRGLIPGTTDQSFVLCVSKTFKSFYDSVASRDPNERRFSRRHMIGLPNWEERWKTHLTIKKFLSGFLDHCFKNVDYIVKERHILEKLLDMEFMDANREKSIFYIDKKYSFDQTIFYGNEWALATFEASVFLLVLVFSGSYILSAIMTIFLSSIIEFSVKFRMNRNLAETTLIDDRFLMS